MDTLYLLPPKIIRIEFSEGDNRYSFFMHESAFKEFIQGSTLNLFHQDAKTGKDVNPCDEALKALKL